jgi:hypothetical protein
MLQEAQNPRLPAAVWQGWLAGSNPRFQLSTLLINILFQTIQLGDLRVAFGLNSASSGVAKQQELLYQSRTWPPARNYAMHLAFRSSSDSSRRHTASKAIIGLRIRLGTSGRYTRV